MSRTLTHRLQSLQSSYNATLNLISELQTLPASTSESQRLELASEIHDTLKEQEDTLDLLRQELDDIPFSNTTRRPNQTTDHERNADLIARLTEDLKSARGKFRRAQLSAKRSADSAKRKEREQLFNRSATTATTDENGLATDEHTATDAEARAAVDAGRVGPSSFGRCHSGSADGLII